MIPPGAANRRQAPADRQSGPKRTEHAARRQVLVQALAEHAPGVRLTGLAAGLPRRGTPPSGSSRTGRHPGSPITIGPALRNEHLARRPRSRPPATGVRLRQHQPTRHPGRHRPYQRPRRQPPLTSPAAARVGAASGVGRRTQPSRRQGRAAKPRRHPAGPGDTQKWMISAHHPSESGAMTRRPESAIATLVAGFVRGGLPAQIRRFGAGDEA